MTTILTVSPDTLERIAFENPGTEITRVRDGLDSLTVNGVTYVGGVR